MKRAGIVWLLILAMIMSVISGCGQKKQEEQAAEPEQESSEVEENSLAGTEEAPEVTFSTDVSWWEDVSKEEPEEPEKDPYNSPDDTTLGGSDTLENVKYVMIYNPKLYDQNSYLDVSKASTGTMSDQIVTGMIRGNDLHTIDEPIGVSQGEIGGDVAPSDMDSTGNKAGLEPIYRKGDSENFMICDETMTSRKQERFTCVYDGSYCYIWALNGSISEMDAAKYGDAFDKDVYLADTDTFGQGRFTENGGKVHILFYPLQNSILGFFTAADIFAQGELSPQQEAGIGPNYGKAIININELFIGMDEEIIATLAHEYQHQICASDTVMNNGQVWMDVWLNESMSAYAEELIYPGTKAMRGYNYQMYIDDLYRKGQSLYHFAHDPYTGVIGDYGSVYLYAMYMIRENGDQYFKNVHDQWRLNCSKFDNQMALTLYDAAEVEYRTRIEATYQYPQEFDSYFTSPEQAWMSKSTLEFMIQTAVSGELGSFTSQSEVDYIQDQMIYGEINPAEIEGGGRIIVETKNGRYDIPQDADDCLVYIGFDENFQVVTNLITKYGSFGPGNPGDSQGTDEPGTVQPTGDFKWNGGFYTAFAAIDDLENTDGAESLAQGLADAAGSRMMPTYRRKGLLSEDLETLLSSDNLGLVVVMLDGADAADKQAAMNLLPKFYEKGTLVVVFDSTQPSDSSSWQLFADYSQISPNLKTMIDTYDSTTLHNIGYAVGVYLPDYQSGSVKDPKIITLRFK